MNKIFALTRNSALNRIICRTAAASVLAIAALASLIPSNPATAAEPALEIAFGAKVERWSRADLLKHPAVRTIEVPADVAYRRAMRFRAIPLPALIAQLAQSESVQFVASDGFVANIPGALLASDAQPWLAIESPDLAWPALKPGGPSAGPFYLVWLAPEKNGISPEQWPYQIARIAQALPLEKRYPQILPAAATGPDSAERRGLQVFTANCAVCHKINGGGDASIGPDLNKPFGPTEYFQEAFLRQLIRNPASVRDWGQRTMPGFSQSVLSDAQMDDLLAYLRQMVKQR